MSRRYQLWIFTASALLCTQAGASLVLPHSFALVALTDLIQLLLLLSGTMALLLAALASHGRARRIPLSSGRINERFGEERGPRPSSLVAELG